MDTDVDFTQTPLLVVWEITRACELACQHCRASAINCRDPEELDLYEGKRLLNQISEMGTSQVVFTGGDPLQREDLDELIRYATALGLRAATIPATTERLTLQRVRELKAAGLDQMAVSIDASTAQAHDAFRSVPAAFGRAIQAAEFARIVGLPFQVNTVFCKWNADDFEGMARLVEGLGVALWEVFFLVPTGRRGTVLESCDAEQYQRLFDQLEEMSERVPFVIKVTEAPQYRAYLQWKAEQHGDSIPESDDRAGVNAGKGFCFIDHVGNVYPSGFLPLVAGNVRAESVIELYRDSPLFRILRDSSQLKGACRWCDYKELCGGSRARAYAVNGDYLSQDPNCMLSGKMLA
ncbi:MAG: radical SAM protein, partial [Rhodothermales bacterium]